MEYEAEINDFVTHTQGKGASTAQDADAEQLRLFEEWQLSAGPEYQERQEIR